MNGSVQNLEEAANIASEFIYSEYISRGGGSTDQLAQVLTISRVK